MNYREKYLKYKKKYLQLKKQNGGAISITTEEDLDYLFKNIRGRKDEIVLDAIEHHPNLINIQNSQGNTLLHIAIQSHSSIEFIKELVYRGSDINIKNIEGKDSLFLAVEINDTGLVNFLIKRGANPSTGNRYYNAIGLAAYHDNIRICEILLSHGADPMVLVNNKNALDLYGTYNNIHIDRKQSSIHYIIYLYLDYINKQKNTNITATPLFLSPKYSDIVFIADGERIPAHKCILCSNSEIMDKILNGIGVIESEINFKESAEAVKEMLRFIYTGEINKDTLLEHLQDVIQLSDKYILKKLKEECEKFIIEKLTLDDIIDTMKIAEFYNMHKIKNECIDIIKSNRQLIIKDDKFRPLANINPELWAELQIEQTQIPRYWTPVLGADGIYR